MQAKRIDRMIRAERIALFQVDRQSKPQYNPQEDATNNLLEISNQQNDFIEQDCFQIPRQEPDISSRASRLRPKIPVVQNFTKSHRNWRKTCVNFLSGQEVCVMRKDHVVNLSNFLIFENDELRGNLPESRLKLEQLDSPTRPKNSKMLINFMRKRNLNYQKQSVDLQEGTNNTGWKRVGSTLQRINKSCELKREQEEPINKMTRQLSNRSENTNYPDFRATSPNFRNKKVMNYFKYRLNKNAEPY